MPILLKTPDAQATPKQLYKLHQLTGEDTSNSKLTMQQASDAIDKLTNGQIPIVQDDAPLPFNEAKVTLIEGDQGSGKSVTAVGMVVDSWYRACIVNYLKESGIEGICKGYDRIHRIARIKTKTGTKLIRIPQEYELHSSLRIFANFHLYGIPFVYIPSFGHLLQWLKAGLIVNAILLIDEYYIGGNARDCMSAFGKELEKQSFQMRKMQLEVSLITPIASLIDKYARLTPTKHILCSYDKKRYEVTLTVKEKGVRGSRVLPPFDARQYFPFYWTNERINR